jgi:hypothetical protein
MSLWTCDIPGVEGIFDINVQIPRGIIDRHSHVMASICELGEPQGEPLDYPFKGLAGFTLHNVVPLTTVT